MSSTSVFNYCTSYNCKLKFDTFYKFSVTLNSCTMDTVNGDAFEQEKFKKRKKEIKE